MPPDPEASELGASRDVASSEVASSALQSEASSLTQPLRTNRTALVVRMLEEGQQEGLFAPNVVAHQPWANAIAQATGPEKLLEARSVGFLAADPASAGKATLSTLKTAFPDLQIQVEDTIESGDEVVVRWRLSGTHTGAVLGFAACDQKVEFTGINIYRFAGDTIAESWGELDLGSLALQAESCARAVVAAVSLPAELIAASK